MTDTIAKVLEFHEALGSEVATAPGLPAERSDAAGIKRVFGGDMLDKALTRFREGAALGDARCLRLALLTEELLELCDSGTATDALDALVDLRYVLDGTVIAFGFHLPTAAHHNVPRFYRAFNRVHAANMAKLQPDGTVKRDATGKVVKPEGWTAPDLSDLVV